ncbi:DDE-type integrase/transposase/recombinase [Sedimentitalea sp.]
MKVKDRWAYLYRPIEICGKTLDFMLPERRDEVVAAAFFAKVIASNG